jgi:hypothetical protein
MEWATILKNNTINFLRNAHIQSIFFVHNRLFIFNELKLIPNTIYTFIVTNDNNINYNLYPLKLNNNNKIIRFNNNYYLPFKIISNEIILERQSINIKNKLVIGDNTSNSSAILDLNSNNRGFLPPRINNVSNISNPVAGLIIYDTTYNILRYFNGKEWINI